MNSSSNRKPVLKRVLLTLVLVALIAASFAGGLYWGTKQESSATLGIPINMGGQETEEQQQAAENYTELAKRLVEVKQKLDADALVPSNLDQATAGVVQGLLSATGDTYAYYFDEPHYKYYMEENSGEFAGIGVVLSEYEGQAYITDVYQDTPAALAGIQAGDFIVAINGDRDKTWSSDDVVRAVRGEPGKMIEITWRRPANKEDKGGEEFTETLITSVITYPNVEVASYDGVYVVSIAQFNEKTTDEVRNHITNAQEQGARGLVLDLRGNPGGLLDQAVELSSLFIDSGTVVEIESRTAGTEHLTVKPDSHLTDLPLVVLVNGDSASASEIVAAALQDHKRALVIGEQTFGKGTVQTIESLSFGGGIKYTIAHYVSPDGLIIDRAGVAPDMVVAMDPQLRSDSLEQDIQLAAALDAVNQIITLGSLEIEELSNQPDSEPQADQSAISETTTGTSEEESSSAIETAPAE